VNLNQTILQFIFIISFGFMGSVDFIDFIDLPFPYFDRFFSIAYDLIKWIEYLHYINSRAFITC